MKPIYGRSRMFETSLKQTTSPNKLVQISGKNLIHFVCTKATDSVTMGH